MKESELIQIALDCGAAKATVLRQNEIVLSAEFRKICQSNQCGGYGRCWMCPPYIGDIQDLMSEVRQYSSALWFQTIHSIEDSFDIEGMFEAGSKHAKTSVEIRKKLSAVWQKPFLLLSCGGCHLCEKCAKLTDEPCRFPDQALASLEGYGVDVYRTTQHTDLRYINGENTVTYFGMVLFTE